MNVFSKLLLCADISGETEEVLLKRAAEHAVNDHLQRRNNDF